MSSPQQLPDEPSALTLATELVRRRRVLVGFAAAGLLVGALTGLLSRRVYSSSATFLPQASADQAMAGGLALAAQFGIRVPSGGTTWGPAIYAELISSRGMLARIATDSIHVAEMGGKWVTITDLLDVDETDPAQRLEKTIRALRKVVSGGEVKRIGAVQITVRTRWPSVSYALANRTLEEINRFNLESRKSQAIAERTFTEAQTKEAEQLLKDAEDRMAEFTQQNRVSTSPELSVKKDRLQREITLRQQTYTSLLQSYSEARLREVRDTPVISVLESPVLPVMGEARKSALKGVVGTVAGVLFGMIVVLVRTARRSSSPQLQSLFNAVDEALPRRLRGK